jgi:hypothetical protein
MEFFSFLSLSMRVARSVHGNRLAMVSLGLRPRKCSKIITYSTPFVNISDKKQQYVNIGSKGKEKKRGNLFAKRFPRAPSKKLWEIFWRIKVYKAAVRCL